jgi:outer membrane protein
MKKFCCSAVLLFVSLFYATDACLAAAASLPRRIGMVRMQALYQESQAGTAAFAWLQELQNGMQKKFEEIQARRTAAEEAGDEAAKEEIQVEMQAVLYTLQNTIGAEQERIFALVEELVRKSSNRYLQENSFAVLLNSEAAAAFAPETDVTADIIALMDQEPLDFGEIPSLDVPPGAASPRTSGTAGATPRAEPDPDGGEETR